MTPMQIADTIRKAVDADGRTQRDIAAAAGIHYVNLSQWKAGRRGLSLEALCELAHVVGLEIVARPLPRRPNSRAG